MGWGNDHNAGEPDSGVEIPESEKEGYALGSRARMPRDRYFQRAAPSSKKGRRTGTADSEGILPAVISPREAEPVSRPSGKAVLQGTGVAKYSKLAWGSREEKVNVTELHKRYFVSK